MLFDLNRTSSQRIWLESRQIVHLALPMLIAQVAQVATSFVDTVMSGHVSTGDLAAVSLGSSIFLTCYVTLLGLVTALNPILAHLQGAGSTGQIGEHARQGIWFGLFVGLFGMALMLALEQPLRPLIHLPPAVVDKTMLFITGTALAMPAALMHRALHAIASSLNRPRPIMFMSLAALALNIPLNYILIHGLYGLPRMGGAGCGWATAVAFWFNCTALFGYIAFNRYFAPYALFHRFSWPDWRAQANILRLGLPIGLSFFVEISLFSFIALLIARLGTVVVASHQTVLNFSSIIYMVPQSISTALSVRVGHSAGAGNYRDARLISGIGLMIGLVSAAGIMALTLGLRTQIIGLYTDDPHLIAIGASLLIYAAVYQLADATQTIASGALRGYKLTAIPMLIHISSFWIIGLGLGITLGLTDWLTPAPMGVYGFWSALVVSLSAAALLLIRYLSRQSRILIRTHSDSCIS
jgi:MATE family multidrug resistance protein